jgi:hypothetical protein
VKIELKAASSSGDTYYTVEFSKHEDGKLRVFCSCPAGELGKFCKHKWRLMGGDQALLWDKSDGALLAEALKWVDASDFPSLYTKVNELEAQIETLKAELSKEKKNVERRIREGF